MEAASIPESPTARPPRPVAKAIADNILWLLMGLALLFYFIQDPKQTLDDVKTGLSNGTIWALIALGYTLVYGIIELINFAHGEVFMIGSFVSVSIWQTLGVTPGQQPHRDPRIDAHRDRPGDARLRDAQRDDRAGGLQAAAQRAQAGAAHHRDRHELHPAERRPAVARRSPTARPTSSAPRRTTSRSSAWPSSTPTCSPSSSPSRCSSRSSGSWAPRATARRCAPPRRIPTRRG